MSRSLRSQSACRRSRRRASSGTPRGRRCGPKNDADTRSCEDLRPADKAVFQYLDAQGTTVSTLAERAEMTKQAMGELVLHLERRGYVDRLPDPNDRRAKLVRPTAKGRRVYAVVRELIPEMEQMLAEPRAPREYASCAETWQRSERPSACRDSSRALGYSRPGPGGGHCRWG